MGGGSFGSSSGPKSIKVTTKISVAAHFGRDGQLQPGEPGAAMLLGDEGQPEPAVDNFG